MILPNSILMILMENERKWKICDNVYTVSKILIYYKKKSISGILTKAISIIMNMKHDMMNLPQLPTW